jgi:phage portal protein BeeE
MSRRTFQIFDGSPIKSTLIWDENTDAWTYHSEAPAGGSLMELSRIIPVCYRAIEMRADTVASVPFSVYRGDVEVSTSVAWQDPTEAGFTDPRRLFRLVSQSLDKCGCAYLLKAKNQAGYTRELRYLSPATITPDIDPERGLIGFNRSIGTRTFYYKPEDLIYFWLPDPDVELGPPLSYPLKAAGVPAGILGNLDEFMLNYFRRGAIRPLVVTAKGMPSKEERERMETWTARLMTGLKNAFKPKVFNADSVSFQQIGDGLDQLQNQTLTADQRQAVAMSIGVPEALLFSSANSYATAQVYMQSFIGNYILPRCELIAATINAQFLEPLGLSLQFSAESMDAFKQDELASASAVGAYVSAGVPLLMALDLLGVDLTPEQRAELEETDSESEAQPETPLMPAPPTPPESPEQESEQGPVKQLTPETAAELKRWKRLAIKRFRAGEPAPIDWTSDHIQAGDMPDIRQALAECKTSEDVSAAFVTDDSRLTSDAALVVELKRANDLLEAMIG